MSPLRDYVPLVVAVLISARPVIRYEGHPVTSSGGSSWPPISPIRCMLLE